MSDCKAHIMDSSAVDRTLTRLAHEIVERDDIERTVLVGIKRRGLPLAKVIGNKLEAITGKKIPIGEIDISFYRDDLTTASDSPTLNSTELLFDVENKTVVLVDDVLFTGRTCRAAIEAVMAQGRPAAIRLAVLVDRGHRELPIRADYVGKNIPTSRSERVFVCVPEYDGESGVKLYDL